MDGYASDADELETRQLQEFSGFERAAQVIACLEPGLGADIAFWEKGCKRVHPSDLALVREFVAKKAGLHQAMRGYLSAHGDEGG